jgi:hypothetical protein
MLSFLLLYITSNLGYLEFRNVVMMVIMCMIFCLVNILIEMFIGLYPCPRYLITKIRKIKMESSTDKNFCFNGHIVYRFIMCSTNL